MTAVSHARSQLSTRQNQILHPVLLGLKTSVAAKVLRDLARTLERPKVSAVLKHSLSRKELL